MVFFGEGRAVPCLNFKSKEMKPTMLTLISILTACSFATAQPKPSWTWAKAISDAEVSHVCTDNSGNIYSTGTFRDTSQNPGSAIRKAFVAKYDPQGNLIWSRPF